MRHAVTAIALATITLAACGKKSGGGGGGASLEGPTGLEADQVASVAGTTELPKVLADLESMRAKLRAEMAKSDPDFAAEGDAAGPIGALMTPAGWAEAGLDPAADALFVNDRRVTFGDDRTPAPIMVVKIVDRDKLLGALRKLDDKLTFGGKVGEVETLLRGDDEVAFFGPYGDRTAFVPATFGGGTKELRAGFEAFLAGKGAPLAEADRFKRAMAAGPSGAGVYYWFGDMAQLEMVGHLFDMRRRSREGMATMLATQLDGVGLRVGQDGLSLRVVPKASMADAFAKIYTGNDSPKDIGRVIPAKGWAAGRISLDLEGGVSAALSTFGLGDGALQSTLGRLGLSWDDITGALSGEIGGGVDLTSLIADRGREGLPTSIYALGVKDGDKADALVDKLAVLAAREAELARRDITVAGKKGLVLGGDFFAVVVVRADDLLLVAQSETTMASALALMDGDNLSKTSAGEVLRQKLSFAAVADMTPVLTWLDGVAAGTKRSARMPRLIRTALPEAFLKDPTLVVRTGHDGDAHFTWIGDHGLSYTLGLLGLVSSFVEARPRKSEIEGLGGPVAVVAGEMPAICKRFIDNYARCVEAMPEATRGPARDALKQMSDAWAQVPADTLEPACKQGYDAMKSAAASMCPDVKWE